MKKCLVFDFFSDLAHFKRVYTTTSSYTYLIPPKTTIVGLICAIIGEKEYYKFIEKTKIAIQVLSPIRTKVFIQNYLKTDGAYSFKNGIIKERSQIPVEYIINPKYKIFVYLEESDKYEVLKKFLENKKSIYTPYAGISECIANIEYFGEYNITETKEKFCDSVVFGEEYIKNIKINDNGIIQNLIPTSITKDRITKETICVYISSKKIEFNEPVQLYKIGDKYVVQFV